MQRRRAIRPRQASGEGAPPAAAASIGFAEKSSSMALGLIHRDFLHSGHRPEHIRLEHRMRLFFKSPGQVAHEVFYRVRLHQTDRTAAKAPARHSRSVNASASSSEIHQQIELRAAYLKVIA